MVSPAQERRFLVMLFVGIGVPLSLITALIAADTRVDLSDLLAKTPKTGSEPVIGWTALSRSEPTEEHPPSPESMITMIGYMMEPREAAVQDNSRVRMFTLLPEAGRIFHPAHHYPDQMVSIWLRLGAEVPFKDRSLVWVRGRFEYITPLTRAEPLYALREAATRPASLADIRSHFGRPY